MMRTQKIIPAILTGMILFSMHPVLADVPAVPVHTSNPVSREDPATTQLLQRLKEIREAGKATLTRSDRKSLRKDVKGIRKEMKKISGGVYLPAGANFIAILLLILHV